MYTYAILNEEGVCISITRLNNPVNNDNYIQLDFYDLSKMGLTYRDGEWVDERQPVEEEEPSEIELLEISNANLWYDSMMKDEKLAEAESLQAQTMYDSMMKDIAIVALETAQSD